ncbi:MAG: hypothetical protein IPL61_14345 [Myxococcales bacterium]|nr:hypothetical protein [Myxococcales bacterium]
MPGMMRAGTLAGLAVLAAAGCYTPDFPVGLPCSADHRCPEGQTCDPVTDVCTRPTSGLVWRDDLAADFARPGASFDDTVIEEPGAIAPTPYLTGGLRMTGINGARFTTPGAASWAAVADAVPAGRGFLRYVGFDVGYDRPLGVALTDGDDVTVAFEGEIYLEAGSWQFALDASDVGFVELASDGDFAPLIATDDTDTGHGQRDIPVDGWYPIRGAVADVAGLMYLYLEAGGPDPGDSPGWIDPERLRARVDDLSGVALDGFDDPHALSPTATGLRTSPLAATTFDDDLAVGDGSWSLRYAGQVRIDVTGTYVLHVDSFAGHRVWIDGAEQIDDLGYDGAVNDTPPLALEAGWHDLVIEQQWGGPEPASLSVTVASGPELVGQGFPVERTRPVIGRGVRWSNEGCWWEDVPDDGAVSCSAWLGYPDGAQPFDLQSSWEVTHPVLTSVGVELLSPNDDVLSFASPGDLTGAGDASDHVDLGLSHGVAGEWRLTVRDTVADGEIGTLDSLNLTVSYADGGVAPFPKVARFTSGVRDLGAVVSYGPMRWQLRQAARGGAVVWLRTCATAAACDAEPWTEVDADTVPAVTPRQFAQYQVELSGDGDVPTALDWIELPYRAE